MDLNKLKSKKKFFDKKEDKTSRNDDRLYLGIERYVRFTEIINIWKRATYLFVFISIIFVGLSVYGLKKAKIIPYVVRMDTSTGALVETKVLKSEGINLNEKEIEYFVRKFYSNIRTVTLDRKIFNKTMQETSTFLTPSSQKKLNQMLEESKINELFEQKNTKNIEILSYNKIPSVDNGYQVRWIEYTYNKNGEIENKYIYNAITKIDFFTPTKNEIYTNPLGIVIVDFTISKESSGEK